MEAGDPSVEIEKNRRYTARRRVGIGALAAVVGITVWAALRMRRSPAVRERASEFTAAAQRLYAHPERLARGNERPIFQKVLEIAATTMAKTIAAKLAISLLRAAVVEPVGDPVARRDSASTRGFVPLPA